MRLFLLYFIVFFLSFLMHGSGAGKESAEENTPVETTITETMVSSDFSISCPEKNWLKTYFWILQVVNPGKQFDIPSDYNKYWNFLSVRDISALIGQNTICSVFFLSGSKYFRFLSARHVNGFYIFLRKLVI